MPENKRKHVVRKKTEYGKWQLDQLEEIVLTEIEGQDADGIFYHPDFSK